jgi:GTP-binding protein LepA
MKYLTATRVTFHYEVPLAEILTDFFDELKSITKGYASMSFQEIGYRKNNLVKLEIRINDEDAPPLATILHRDKAYEMGRKICLKLKELIPRQLFKVPIQACIGSKVIASEHIQSVGKDVLAKCYGGDVTRKKKLLAKQAEGKKRMKMLGKVNVPQEAFLSVLRASGSQDKEQ